MTTPYKKRIPGPGSGQECPSIWAVLQVCCDLLGVTLSDLRDGNRRPRVVLAKALFAYCSRAFTHASTGQLAETVYGEKRSPSGKVLEPRGRSNLTVASNRVYENLDMTAKEFVASWKHSKFAPPEANRTLREWVEMVKERLA